MKPRRSEIHFEALLPKQREVLTASAGPAKTWGAYLAGGLAVALQLGHRVSADFDWFTASTIPPDKLLADISATGLPVAVRQNDEGTFLAQVDGIEYSVFRYRYDVVAGLTEVEGCQIASLEDIGAMKLAAICQRSVKRDYVDLHAILTSGSVSVDDLTNAWNRKYPGKDVGFALRALVYFADVDKARMPEMLVKTGWDKIKAELEKLVAS
ncbi:MAG: nucleotidyl transferase AbiEii/AbiGii toxin family protein [Polyangia bacterium]|jgi:hypothetical protein